MWFSESDNSDNLSVDCLRDHYTPLYKLIFLCFALTCTIYNCFVGLYLQICNIVYNIRMNLKDAINLFLSDLKRKGYSSKTIKAYDFDLGKLSEFLCNQSESSDTSILVSSINTNDLRLWADHCLDNNNTPRTLSRKMATCKSFFRFLVIESIVDVNPADRVSLPKTPKKPPSALSQDEIRQLINAPVPDERDYLRNKAILLLMYSAGLRVSEIVSMKMEQLLLERQAVRVRGKGAKDRILPLADSSRKAVIDYFLDREKKLPSSIDPKAPAFVTSKGEPMTVRMIQYMVYKYGRSAAIPLHVHPHLIRHSIATHLIEEGCSVEAVRQTLGHEDLATTSIYLKASSKFLKDEHRKYNPSDKLSE